jgi:hypothetical protein
MPRLQDILFGILGVAIAIMLAYHLGVAVLAIVGAFACGSIYLLAGMLPGAHESFGQRVFVSVFLAVVVSSLVLILPGTFGTPGPRTREAVIVLAALIPLLAVCFEIVRTPRVLRGILWCLGVR